MNTTVQLIENPREPCVLCGDSCLHNRRHSAFLRAVSDDGKCCDGWVCHDCLFRLSSAEDPQGWLVDQARLYESHAFCLQEQAERLRLLAGCDLSLPSREEREEIGYHGDVPF